MCKPYKHIYRLAIIRHYWQYSGLISLLIFAKKKKFQYSQQQWSMKTDHFFFGLLKNKLSLSSLLTDKLLYRLFFSLSLEMIVMMIMIMISTSDSTTTKTCHFLSRSSSFFSNYRLLICCWCLYNSSFLFFCFVLALCVCLSLCVFVFVVLSQHPDNKKKK